MAHPQAQTTEIPGLLLFDLETFGDDRGWFQEKYQFKRLTAAGLPDSFRVVQNNVSYNKQIGVTRGIHAEPWNKYISVVSGEVFCAFVDLRDGKTFGNVVTLNITPEKAVYLPKGCGNNFQTIKPDTYYSYLVDDYWTKEKYDEYMFVNLGDPDLNIQWPTPLDKAILSDRDKDHPLLGKVKNDG